MKSCAILGLWLLLLSSPLQARLEHLDSAIQEDFEGRSRTCIADGLRKRNSAQVGFFGTDGSMGVRVRYAGNDNGSERTVFSCPLKEKGLEYTLQYDVRFDHDFQFVQGGKLHGLGPDKVMSGGDGIVPDGWSARVCFRRGGGLETYVYNQDQQTNFGQIDRAKDFVFDKGRYYRITFFVRVNSAANNSDGIVRLWVGNRLLVERANIRFRGVDGDRGLISRVLFSTFHGGSTPDFAPKTSDGGYSTVHADFDNFIVRKGPPRLPLAEVN